MKSERRTVVKSLSFKAAIILLSIALSVFVGHPEVSGVERVYVSKNLSSYSYLNQQSITNASMNTVRVRFKSPYELQSTTVKIGARLGHRWYPKSESMPIIIIVGVAVWGAAIIFVLGLILYQVVIEPLVQKKKEKTE